MTARPDCARCGCPHEVHTHLHAFDYCGTCAPWTNGRPECHSYRPPAGRFGRWLKRLLHTPQDFTRARAA